MKITALLAAGALALCAAPTTEARLGRQGRSLRVGDLPWPYQPPSYKDEDDLGRVGDLPWPYQPPSYKDEDDLGRVGDLPWPYQPPSDKDEDDLGGVASALMSPTAFRIANIGQRFGPWVGPAKSAMGLDEDDDDLGARVYRNNNGDVVHDHGNAKVVHKKNGDVEHRYGNHMTTWLKGGGTVTRQGLKTGGTSYLNEWQY